MSFILIPLMAYQVTGEAAHEWFGISMVSLVFLENVSMLIFFAFVAHNLANALKGIGNLSKSSFKIRNQ